MSRNSDYEKRKKSQGTGEKTIWIPEVSSVEFSQMAQFCCEHPDCIPYMARSISSGKMKKAV